ncbi:hypothetical protein Tco_0914580 [Tanacetum coccineum]
MADLLKYLNNTLDSAAMNARLPSGQNPFEQLVIIIAGGSLHEKKKEEIRKIPEQLILSNVRQMVREMQAFNKQLEETVSYYYTPCHFYLPIYLFTQSDTATVLLVHVPLTWVALFMWG